MRVRHGGTPFRRVGCLAWEWRKLSRRRPLSADLDPQIASEAGVTALEEMIRATELFIRRLVLPGRSRLGSAMGTVTPIATSGRVVRRNS